MSGRRGWCPDLFAPMRSGDGLLLRIKPRGGRLSAADALLLADAARRFGNGALQISNRGNLQFRGFSERTAPSFAQTALDAGLAAADAAVERRRNLMLSPLLGDDPGCDREAGAIAAAIETALAGPGLDHLPGKFGFVVDGGGSLPLSGVPGDVAVRRTRSGWRVEAAGAALACAADAAAAIALALARQALPDRRWPADPAVGLALFAHAGCDGAEPLPTPDVPAPPVAVGALGHGLFGVGAPAGQLDASKLSTLATLSARLGDGVLRLTPFRAVLLGGLPPAAIPSLRQALAGWLIDPADARLRTAACVGRPGCAHASVAAPADAAALSPLVPPGGFLHVSGCAKGCGHPGPAPLTLVGRNGVYDLVRNGRAGDPPCRRGLRPSELPTAADPWREPGPVAA